MKTNLMVLSLLATFAIRAEDKSTAEQFTLEDGRVVQAVRSIKIVAKGKTSYLITLDDGTKLSLTADDVSKVETIDIPASRLPPSLNIEKKVAEPVVPVPQNREAPSPPVVVIIENPPAVVPSGDPDPLRYGHYHAYRRYEDCPPVKPPSPVSSSPTQPYTPTAEDIARRAFSTIPAFQATGVQARK